MDNSSIYEILRFVTIFFAAIMLVKYVVFLFAAAVYSAVEAKRKARFSSKEYTPKVSVLVPAWNEEVGIIKTIESVLENSYSNIELIVVNDGSTDKTDQLVRNFRDRYTMRAFQDLTKTLVYIEQENQGKGAALNSALEVATGEIIVTVDADSFLDRYAIKHIVEKFKDPSVDAVVGNVKVGGAITVVGLLQKLEYLFGFYFKRAHSVLGSEYIYGGACAAFRHETCFKEHGNFDTKSVTEDIDLSLRTRHHGLKAVYAEQAICVTEGASRLVDLVKQRLRWKRGRFSAFSKHRNLFFSRTKHHSKWLSWFVLPLAMLAEIQMIFEPIGVTLLVTYSLISGDYTSLALGILLIFITYVVVGLFTNRLRNAWVILVFPFTWPLFYILMWVEYGALVHSLKSIASGREVKWQRWERLGLIDDERQVYES